MERIRFGREVTSVLGTALRREWLVTNGIGGYASGTIAMTNTRRYHGLLVAALQPPVGRTLLVSKLEATVRLGTDLYHLTTNEYVDGTINPHGYHNLEAFELDGSIPVFTWAIADNLLEQRVWMVHGQNSTYVTYTLVRALRPLALEIIPLCTYRAARETTDARGWSPSARSAPGGIRVDAGFGSIPYWLRTNRGTFVPGVVRHWSLRHRAESYRGLEDTEDLYAVGRLDTSLAEGETLAFLLTTEPEPEMEWDSAYEVERTRQQRLLDQSGLQDEPGWVQRLALAADQFLADRHYSPGSTSEESVSADERGKTVIAGFPWFGDFGRDTMVSLPGLTLATGRPEIAASILRTYAGFLSDGLLPNRLPGNTEDSSSKEYGTADATLWYFHALHQYVARTGDLSLLQELYRTLADVLDWHLKGTRYEIGVDESDGLLRIGEASIGLTWMNAQDGDRIVTPRVGKPVEINALWHNALGTMSAFAAILEKTQDANHWQKMAARVAEQFGSRFWYPHGGHLYDVIDGPDGDDATLRPNQILAVSLPYSPLTDEKKARSVVDVVAQHLVTSYGLRTLSPRNPAYAHRYGGNQSVRASACHQGTVWAWLLGPFATAHVKVYGDLEKARSFLRPLADHLANHGLGTISEVFDGDPPHTPRGCVGSAWSVAEALCGWLACREQLGHDTGAIESISADRRPETAIGDCGSKVFVTSSSP
jgi:predicted glycogen debranching enzyme